jgi:hypothetical protein
MSRYIPVTWYHELKQWAQKSPGKISCKKQWIQKLKLEEKKNLKKRKFNIASDLESVKLNVKWGKYIKLRNTKWRFHCKQKWISQNIFLTMGWYADFMDMNRHNTLNQLDQLCSITTAMFQLFYDITLCCWVSSFQCFRGSQCPTIHQNIRKY